MQFNSLASGSSGNSQYLKYKNTEILIDAGLSGKKIEEALKSIGKCPTNIDAIFVTHEHIDHINGVGVLSRRHNIPIYANKKTWENMLGRIGKISEENIKIFDNDRYINFKNLNIKPIGTYHDASDPVGYIINNEKKKISILTDTGEVDDYIIDSMKGSDFYFIESNHDEFMLKEGIYPKRLKDRISGPEGHLSNRDTGNILLKLLEGKKEKICLGHLSKDNNIPILAYETIKNMLLDEGLDLLKESIDLMLADRNKVSKTIEL